MRSAMWVVAVSGLGTAAATVAAQQAPAAEPAKPKMICKRSVDTGSLVAKRRECRTKQDWERLSEAARMNGQDMVDRGMGRPGGR